jgi:hypothetical protein
MKYFKLATILLTASVFSINSYAQTTPKSTISVEKVSPEIRQVKFANAPINVIVPETISSLKRVAVFGTMYGKIGVEKLEQNMGYYLGEGNKQLQKK